MCESCASTDRACTFKTSPQLIFNKNKRIFRISHRFFIRISPTHSLLGAENSRKNHKTQPQYENEFEGKSCGGKIEATQ
jgi:hypothetical protein